MKTGKLTNEQLNDIVLSKLPALSSNTLVGAGIGADCAWCRVGENLMVTSSDPITAGGMQAGTLAVHVSCNDIAACGVRPSGILLVIIAPTSASEEDLRTIVDQASSESAALGVDIVGGHTEVSDSVNTFVVITTAFGIVTKDHPIPIGKAREGDKLILTKTCGIEGSYIAAKEHYSKLKGKISAELIEEAAGYDKLISVVPEGSIAGALECSSGEINQYGFKTGAVSLMHDVTEGGVFGAAYEMAHFSGIGVRINEASVPMTEATAGICRVMDIDPYRLISSGSLLIATPEASRVCAALEAEDIRATVIGEFIESGYETVDADGTIRELTPPEADEVYSM